MKELKREGGGKTVRPHGWPTLFGQIAACFLAYFSPPCTVPGLRSVLDSICFAVWEVLQGWGEVLQVGCRSGFTHFGRMWADVGAEGRASGSLLTLQAAALQSGTELRQNKMLLLNSNGLNRWPGRTLPH
eukprot:1147530-Pelagomonas_calceolata.AAC.2